MSAQADRIVDAWTDHAIKRAHYVQMADGRWFASVPGCPGVAATEDTKRDVERELASVLKDWALLGMQLGDDLPTLGIIDLDPESTRHLTA